MGHIMLSLLGNDDDHWWPSRLSLGKNAVEVEAEAVASIVATRFGIEEAVPRTCPVMSRTKPRRRRVARLHRQGCRSD
jgi:hypothetical protein